MAPLRGWLRAVCFTGLISVGIGYGIAQTAGQPEAVPAVPPPAAGEDKMVAIIAYLTLLGFIAAASAALVLAQAPQPAAPPSLAGCRVPAGDAGG